MLREIRPAIVPVIALTLITGVVYPFAISGIAEVTFPDKAQGSFVERDGMVVGSALIGQQFTGRGVFPWPAIGNDPPDPNDSTKDGSGSLQRGKFRRLESRTHQQVADRARPG